jgi:2-oxoglutarate ferredoxin oxidoreductase subunit alpha
MYDFAIKAFNLSEKYRTPVLIMADAVVGHMSEKVVIPPPDSIKLYPRRKPTVPKDKYLPYKPDADLVPAMANAGDGYRFHVTGLTHDERGYPQDTAEAQDKLVRRLVGKIEQNKDDIIMLEEDGLADADVVVCSYGISARISKFAVEKARAEGIKVGMLRLVTVWPFPDKRIDEIAGSIKAFIVPEINAGQIALEVERCAHGKAKTVLLPHMGGGVHRPEVILDAIREAAK